MSEVVPQKRFHPSKPPPTIDRTPFIMMAGILPFTFALEFTLFPILPAELRLKIWDYILDEPRIIDIGLRLSEGEDFDHFFTPTKLPVAFRICRESRKRAFERHDTFTMRHTPLRNGFAWECDRRDAKWQAAPIGALEPEPLRFLINYDMDILCSSIANTNFNDPNWNCDFIWWRREVGLEHFLWHLSAAQNTGTLELRRLGFRGEDVNLFERRRHILKSCERLEIVNI